MAVNVSVSGKLPLQIAMEARDRPAIVETFTPDAVFRSPLTGRLCFTGHDEIAALIDVLLKVFVDFHYVEQAQVGDLAYITARARIGGRDLEIVDRLRLAPDGRIQEMTAFFRPLPAAAMALRLIGAGLARPKSRFRAAVVSFLARPLVLMAALGDRIGVKLVRL